MEEKIKSFIYLDEYKLASLSSQIFEGMTEYILKSVSDTHTEKNTQKGGFATGNVMGDALTEGNASSEKRFLHDFAYTKFETKLLETCKLHIIDSNDSLDSISNNKLIKITGKAIFDDYQAIIDTLNNFNSIGEAISLCSMNSENIDINQILNPKIKTNDRNNKAKIQSLQKAAKAQWNKILEDAGMRLDNDKIKSLETLLRFSYRGQLAIRIICENSDIVALSNLNRNYLRDPIEMLISRFSRKTEAELSLIGIVTQCGMKRAQSTCSPNDLEKIKYSVQNTISQLCELEDAFTGRLDNEFVVEPIAIYHEL